MKINLDQMSAFADKINADKNMSFGSIINEIKSMGYCIQSYRENYGFAGLEFLDEKQYLEFMLKYL